MASAWGPRVGPSVGPRFAPRGVRVLVHVGSAWRPCVGPHGVHVLTAWRPRVGGPTVILGKALGHQTQLPLGGTAVKAPEEAEIPREGAAGEEKVRDDAETGVHVTS